MVRLNHTTLVDNKPVTPFLVQGSNVYCFDKTKQTIILPLTSFKAKKAKKALVVPTSISVQKPKPKPEPPVEEKIIIKAVEIHAVTGGSIRTIGSADYSYKEIKEVIEPVIEVINKVITHTTFNYRPSGFIKVMGLGESRYTFIKEIIPEPVVIPEPEYVPPPVIDNSRYVGRPSLNDDYI